MLTVVVPIPLKKRDLSKIIHAAGNVIYKNEIQGLNTGNRGSKNRIGLRAQPNELTKNWFIRIGGARFNDRAIKGCVSDWVMGYGVKKLESDDAAINIWDELGNRGNQFSM
ncbi:MAG: hypothetical protein C5B53_00580 [Candidatus Melainabacteria bacterium]|nr:MAG: hypothetical protein C5B53_00580 [Candidatus Melainabacteria bacterium]